MEPDQMARGIGRPPTAGFDLWGLYPEPATSIDKTGHGSPAGAPKRGPPKTPLWSVMSRYPGKGLVRTWVSGGDDTHFRGGPNHGPKKKESSVQNGRRPGRAPSSGREGSA